VKPYSELRRANLEEGGGRKGSKTEHTARRDWGFLTPHFLAKRREKVQIQKGLHRIRPPRCRPRKRGEFLGGGKSEERPLRGIEQKKRGPGLAKEKLWGGGGLSNLEGRLQAPRLQRNYQKKLGKRMTRLYQREGETNGKNGGRKDTLRPRVEKGAASLLAQRW